MLGIVVLQQLEAKGYSLHYSMGIIGESYKNLHSWDRQGSTEIDWMGILDTPKRI